MILNFALNYGAQDEIVTSIQKIARLVKNNEIDIDDISKETVQNNLMTTNLGKLANPDLLIRTSGEKKDCLTFYFGKLHIVNLSLEMKIGQTLMLKYCPIAY